MPQHRNNDKQNRKKNSKLTFKIVHHLPMSNSIGQH